MEKEIWKDILGYEGSYQISTHGRVKSLDRYVVYSNGSVRFYKGKILKQSHNNEGRPQVALNRNSKSHTFSVQRLMSYAFMGERPKGYIICHNDGNMLNNNIENLRYDKLRENSIDMYRHGCKVTIGKLSIEDVVEIRRLYATGKYLQKDLANIYNVNQSNISHVIKSETFNWLNDDGSIKESGTATTHKNNT